MSAPTTTTTISELVPKTMEEVLKQFDIVDVVQEPGLRPFVVATPRQLASSSATNVDTVDDLVDIRELGTTSPSPFTSFIRQEYNRDLQGLRGLQKYDQMRRSDGTTRGTMRLVKTPVLAARWFIEPGKGPTGKIRPKDRKIADFVWNCFTKYMSISWSQFLIESLLMCDFGYYMFETVYEPRMINGKYQIVWKKLAPRHPMDVKEWHFDSHGGPVGVSMFSDNNEVFGLTSNDIFIPINKLTVFTFDKEAGNIQGIPMLRSAYKHWYYKEQLYKIDAIQKERHGIGIPLIKLPPGFNDADKNLADQMGRNLRTNERSHIVLPPNWEVMMLKLEGQPVDALKSIEHHDQQIEKSILAEFLSATVGSSKDVDFDLFLKATRFIADTVAQTLNDYLIPRLVDYNFPGVQDYPRLKARRIGESADWRNLSFAIRNFVGANIIQPDDELEKNIREEMDLPPLDEATIRKTATPQAPGAPGQTEAGKPGDGKAPEAGPPRQTPAVNGTAKLPARNAGTDRSGQ
jgi:hypothetical protein